jgi:hypothetical protein
MAESKDTAVQVALLVERVTGLIEKVDKLENDVAVIRQMADRWKGGFLVIVATGSILGWIATMWGKMVGTWH